MPEFDSTHIPGALGAVKMPIGSYDNFQDCVNKNQGKVSDPEAYCGSIQKKVEGEHLINVTNEVLMSLGQIGSDNLLKGAQLMPLGKWNHPLGKIEIDLERAKRFAEQFKRSVTGQKLPILWIHSTKENVSNPRFNQAAGWITDMRADESLGVVVDIQFTDEAAAAVKGKEYAYLSAEYFDRVQLPHHESPEEDVVVAAALVNRPHLKGMNPLLNEETGHQFLLGQAEVPLQGGVQLDPILRQLCEQAKIEVEKDQVELTEAQGKSLSEFLSSKDQKSKDDSTKISLLEKQLADTEDPEKKKARNLEEAGFSEEAKLLSEYRADRMVTSLGEFVPEGHQLSPVAIQEIRKYALEQTSDNLEGVHKLMLSGKALVDMRTIGTEGSDDNPDENVAAKMLSEAHKIAEEQKITFSEAISAYAKLHPQEWDDYQESMGASMAKRGVS